MNVRAYTTKNALETQRLGAEFARSVQGGVLALYGELGSGKTTFVQGLAKGLGIKKRILSPTFVLIRSYPLLKAGFFYHIDLYRLGSVKEAQDLGLEEIWENPQNIVAIEWAEKIQEILPKKRTAIFFKYSRLENTREIHINTLK